MLRDAEVIGIRVGKLPGRMRSLAVNQPNLDNQRNAVQEERRLRYDNAPYGRTFEKISETAYDSFAWS